MKIKTVHLDDNVITLGFGSFNHAIVVHGLILDYITYNYNLMIGSELIKIDEEETERGLNFSITTTSGHFIFQFVKNC